MKRKERSYSGGKRASAPRPKAPRKEPVARSQTPAEADAAAPQPHMTNSQWRAGMEQWSADMGFYSNPNTWLNHDFYRAMAADQEVSVHRCVAEMRARTDDPQIMLLTAVVAMTGARFVPPEDRGYVRKMVDHCLVWYDTMYVPGLQGEVPPG